MDEDEDLIDLIDNSDDGSQGGYQPQDQQDDDTDQDPQDGTYQPQQDQQDDGTYQPQSQQGYDPGDDESDQGNQSPQQGGYQPQGGGDDQAQEEQPEDDEQGSPEGGSPEGSGSPAPEAPQQQSPDGGKDESQPQQNGQQPANGAPTYPEDDGNSPAAAPQTAQSQSFLKSLLNALHNSFGISSENAAEGPQGAQSQPQQGYNPGDEGAAPVRMSAPDDENERREHEDEGKEQDDTNRSVVDRQGSDQRKMDEGAIGGEELDKAAKRAMTVPGWAKDAFNRATTVPGSVRDFATGRGALPGQQQAQQFARLIQGVGAMIQPEMDAHERKATRGGDSDRAETVRKTLQDLNAEDQRKATSYLQGIMHVYNGQRAMAYAALQQGDVSAAAKIGSEAMKNIAGAAGTDITFKPMSDGTVMAITANQDGHVKTYGLTMDAFGHLLRGNGGEPNHMIWNGVPETLDKLENHPALQGGKSNLTPEDQKRLDAAGFNRVGGQGGNRAAIQSARGSQPNRPQQQPKAQTPGATPAEGQPAPQGGQGKGVDIYSGNKVTHYPTDENGRVTGPPTTTGGSSPSRGGGAGSRGGQPRSTGGTGNKLTQEERDRQNNAKERDALWTEMSRKVRGGGKLTDQQQEFYDRENARRGGWEYKPREAAAPPAPAQKPSSGLPPGHENENFITRAYHALTGQHNQPAQQSAPQPSGGSKPPGQPTTQWHQDTKTGNWTPDRGKTWYNDKREPVSNQ